MSEFTYLRRWTHPKCYVGATWPEYYSAGVGQHRESGVLERSNFRCMLQALGGESETVVVVRENHWAVGWVEWIAIHESDTRALAAAEAALERLDGYPILDEDDFSAEEQREADEVWANCYDDAGRLAYIRDHRSSFEFHSWADLRACVRGSWFGGDAGELVRA